ncbi:unnamed protein product, partial [Coccothraustes coccothraustes]
MGMLKSSPHSEGSSSKIISKLGKTLRGHVEESNTDCNAENLGAERLCRALPLSWPRRELGSPCLCRVTARALPPAAVANTPAAALRPAEAAGAKGCHREAQQRPCPFWRLPTEPLQQPRVSCRRGNPAAAAPWRLPAATPAERGPSPQRPPRPFRRPRRRPGTASPAPPQGQRGQGTALLKFTFPASLQSIFVL